MADLQLAELRTKLQAVRPHGISIAKDLTEATEALQKAEYQLALAKVAAWGKTEEKSATGKRNEVEMLTLVEKADVDRASLQLRLVIHRKDLYETMVSALQSEVKTHEIEAKWT